MATNNAINLTDSGIANYDGAGVFTAITLTEFSPLVGGSGNDITSITPLTDGELLIGVTGSDPVGANLTAGTGVTIDNAAGSVTINAVGAGLTWSVVVGATKAAEASNGYIANNAGTTVFTLPATSVVGDVITITGMNNDTGWQVAQNAGNTIFLGTSTTTPGVGGSLACTKTRDTVVLVCISNDADWNCLNSLGNITVV
jgi:hypothetical protein